MDTFSAYFPIWNKLNDSERKILQDSVTYKNCFCRDAAAQRLDGLYRPGFGQKWTAARLYDFRRG